jgi:Fuc2NAc and GlcNAc transferase
LFAGDAGALFVGAVGAFGSLVLIARAGVSPFVPPILFFPILADVLLTMLWRARRGRRLLEPHAEHLYQVTLRAWGSHTPVALAYWGAMSACVVLGVAVSQHADPRASWIALALLAMAAAAISKLARARLDSRRSYI